MNHQEWLTERRNGIGSSDAPAVCNLSLWSTPLEVYCRKLGLIEDEAESPVQRRGKRLEPYVAAEYEEESGHSLTIPPPIIRHNQYPFMSASLDRIRDDGIIVELKTAHPFTRGQWGNSGTDEAPEPYLIQCQHAMYVSDVPRADLAVMIGFDDFRIFHLERNDRLCQRLVEIEAEFWERVKTHSPPEVNWQHPRTPELIEALYRPAGGEITLGTEAAELAREYQALGRVVSSSKQEREVIEAKLTEMMGATSVALLPDGKRICRKEISRKAYSVAATSYTQFSVKEPKEGKVSA